LPGDDVGFQRTDANDDALDARGDERPRHRCHENAQPPPNPGRFSTAGVRPRALGAEREVTGLTERNTDALTLCERSLERDEQLRFARSGARST
jgi:hypothetical protein